MKNPKIISPFLLLLLFSVYTPSAFTQIENKKDTSIVFLVDQMPVFPGGEDSMYRFISSNVVYPKVAKETNINGTVIISFIVEADGSVSNAKVEIGIGGGCDEEALRVVNLMPNWTPGKQAGKPCRVLYKLPLKFSLD